MFRIKKPKGAKLAKKSKSVSSPAKEDQQPVAPIQTDVSTTSSTTSNEDEQQRVRFADYLGQLGDEDKALYHGDSWTISDQGSGS